MTHGLRIRPILLDDKFYKRKEKENWSINYWEFQG
nr:MAG TPA: hypothetical protein [Caudoviricetes sp.]